MIDNKSAFCCPVCGGQLQKDGKSLRCENKHCYDYAKSGYVNLLMSQQGRLHGDDRPMVRARTAFLSAGHYRPLLDQIVETALTCVSDAPKIADTGCGEGWYTQELHNALVSKGFSPETVGVDISRDALTAAAKRPFPAEFAVASLYHIPLPDEWAELILNVFAPDCLDEFARILAPKGYLLKIVPREDHLLELKSAVYESVYENEVTPPQSDAFELISDTVVRYTLHLTDNETICNLFSMTPYARKTSPSDMAKLNALNELDTTAAFSVLLYRKR